MKKIILFSSILLCLFISKPVKAFNLSVSNGFYRIRFTNPTYNIENQTGYNLYVDLDTNQVLYQLNVGDFKHPKFKVSTLTEQQKQYLKKIMYYGYGYSKHSDKSWIYATQLKIWQYLYPDLNVSYLTVSEPAEKCLKELENLLNENVLEDLYYDFNVANPINIFSKENTTILNTNIDFSKTNEFINIKIDEPGNYVLNVRQNKNLYTDLECNYNSTLDDYFIQRDENYSDYYKIFLNVFGYKVKIKSNVPVNWGIFDKNHNLLKKYLVENQVSFFKTENMCYLSQLDKLENWDDIDTLYYIDEDKDYDINLNYKYKKTNIIEEITEQAEIIENPETKVELSKLYLIIIFSILTFTITFFKEIHKKRQKS
mgnify:FL=1